MVDCESYLQGGQSVRFTWRTMNQICKMLPVNRIGMVDYESDLHGGQ